MNHHNHKFNPETDNILPKRGNVNSYDVRNGAGSGRPMRMSDTAASRGRGPENSQNVNKMQGKPSGRKNSRRRRKKTSGAFKVLALIFIIVIILVAAFFIRSFGAGSKSDEKGMKAYNSGDFAGAIQLFQEAINYDKTNAQYYIHLGMAQIRATQFDAALESFTEAESRTHQKTEIQSARRGRGIACLYKGDCEEATKAFTSALESAGSRYTAQEIDILFYLAEAQERCKDSVGSVLTYTQIINQTNDANAYMLRGMAYQQVGDYTNSEKDLYKALEMNQKNYKVYLSLYRVLLAQDKQKDAQRVLREAVALTAKTGEDYTNQGLIYMYLEDYASAQTAFDAAIEEGYTEAYFGKAQTFMRQNDYNAAITNFDLYFAEHVDNAIAYNEYGLCLEKAGRYAEAVTAFALGVALNDRTIDAQLRFNEVNALEKMGQWQIAYEKMQIYVEKYPEDEMAAKELVFLSSRQKN